MDLEEILRCDRLQKWVTELAGLLTDFEKRLFRIFQAVRLLERMRLEKPTLERVLRQAQFFKNTEPSRRELGDFIELPRFDAQGKSLVGDASDVSARVMSEHKIRFRPPEPSFRFVPQSEESTRGTRQKREFAQVVLALVESPDPAVGPLEEGVEKIGLGADMRRCNLEIASEEIAYRKQLLRIFQVVIVGPTQPFRDRGRKYGLCGRTSLPGR